GIGPGEDVAFAFAFEPVGLGELGGVRDRHREVVGLRRRFAEEGGKRRSIAVGRGRVGGGGIPTFRHAHADVRDLHRRVVREEAVDYRVHGFAGRGGLFVGERVDDEAGGADEGVFEFLFLQRQQKVRILLRLLGPLQRGACVTGRAETGCERRNDLRRRVYVQILLRCCGGLLHRGELCVQRAVG